MTNKAKRQAAYKELEEKNVHWTRVNDKTIRVYMSSNGNGSHIEGLDAVNNYLSQMGFFEFNRDFDRICGKGFADYKEVSKA